MVSNILRPLKHKEETVTKEKPTITAATSKPRRPVLYCSSLSNKDRFAISGDNDDNENHERAALDTF